jgi:molybdenum cofactor biosynthesis enzyme MoaA
MLADVPAIARSGDDDQRRAAAEHAAALARPACERVTVSLDTLDASTFRAARRGATTSRRARRHRRGARAGWPGR